MDRTLFSKVLLAVSDYLPVPGRLRFEITPYLDAGCRLVVSDPGRNYADTEEVSCNFEPGAEPRQAVRSMFDAMSAPGNHKVKPVRAPRRIGPMLTRSIA